METLEGQKVNLKSRKSWIAVNAGPKKTYRLPFWVRVP